MQELIQLTVIQSENDQDQDQNHYDDQFYCVPSEQWGQGFATYGGYVAASCYKAAKLLGHRRPLLSAQVNFFAPSPVTGYRIQVTPLRVGKATSVIEASVWAKNRKNESDPDILACKILFTYGEPRGSALSVRTSIDANRMQQLRDKSDTAVDFPKWSGVVPAFLNQFSIRSVEGSIPYSDGSALGSVFSVARTKPWRVADPVEFLILVSDISPPPQIQLLTLPAKTSTMTWMLDLAQPLPETLNDAKRLFVVLQLEQAQNGYGAHSSLIVDADGQILSSGRQVTAVFEQDDGQIGLKNLPKRLAFRAGFGLFRAFAGLKQTLEKK